MKKLVTCALAAATLAAGLSVAGTASADRWRGGYDRHYDRHYGRSDDGAAIALGLLAGAALAGNGRVYVQPSYGYYGRSRGYGSRYYGHARRCWTESRWDPYYGRVPYRVCR